MQGRVIFGGTKTAGGKSEACQCVAAPQTLSSLNNKSPAIKRGFAVGILVANIICDEVASDSTLVDNHNYPLHDNTAYPYTKS